MSEHRANCAYVLFGSMCNCVMEPPAPPATPAAPSGVDRYEAARYLRDLAERLRDYPTEHYKEAAEALEAEAAEEESHAANNDSGAYFDNFVDGRG